MVKNQRRSLFRDEKGEEEIMDFFRKEISLLFEQSSFEVETDNDSNLVMVRVNEHLLDEEKSTLGNSYYKSGNKIEVFFDVLEVKQIIKALQQVLPEDETHE